MISHVSWLYLLRALLMAKARDAEKNHARTHMHPQATRS